MFSHLIFPRAPGGRSGLLILSGGGDEGRQIHKADFPNRESAHLKESALLLQADLVDLAEPDSIAVRSSTGLCRGHAGSADRGPEP